MQGVRRLGMLTTSAVNEGDVPLLDPEPSTRGQAVLSAYVADRGPFLPFAGQSQVHYGDS